MHTVTSFNFHQLYLSQIGIFYPQFKAFRAAFYAYENIFFHSFHLLLLDTLNRNSCFPHNLLQLWQELAAKEFCKGSKLTRVIPSEFGAIFYELQILLEDTLLSKGICFALSNAMNSKSATQNVFQGGSFYQPKDDGKSACVYHFPKTYVMVATENTNFAELAASTLQQCTGSNGIKLCRQGF